MKTQQVRTIYTFSLVILDVVAIILAFIAAYYLRRNIPYPDELANPVPIARYLGLLIVQASFIVATQFFNRQYYIPRALSRVDQFYYSVACLPPPPPSFYSKTAT